MHAAMREAIPCIADLSSKSGSIASCPPSLLHSPCFPVLAIYPLPDMPSSLFNCLRSFQKRLSNASQPSKQPRQRFYRKSPPSEGVIKPKTAQQTQQRHGPTETDSQPVKSFNVLSFKNQEEQPAHIPLTGAALQAHLENIPRHQK